VCGVTLFVAVWPMPQAVPSAVIGDTIIRESHIGTTVTDNLNGTYAYNWTVTSSCGLIEFDQG
jgi:hypothetical protein